MSKQETPKEIIEELTEEPKPGWVHWFFSFTHNLGLDKEKLEKIITNLSKVIPLNIIAMVSGELLE